MIGATVIIKIMPDGQLSLSVPDDKMLALSMLSLARALVEKDIINPRSQIIPVNHLPPKPPVGSN